MKALRTIPEQVGIEETITGVRLSATSKQAQVELYGANAVNGGLVDFTTYFDALSAPDQAVIVDFLKDIIATAAGVTVGTLTGTVFEADV